MRHFYNKWWFRSQNKLTIWWHRQLCKRDKHVWRLHKTAVGHHIGGRFYNICLWCAKEDWDIEIDKKHQR